MSIAKIQKSIFNGEVTVPASKSVAHRALICSFLAGGGNVEPIISSVVPFSVIPSFSLARLTE